MTDKASDSHGAAGLPAGEQSPTTGPGDGRRLRWARHTQERRDAIIEAAIERTEHTAPGGAVHLQEIADGAGVNRTVIYRYFDERADLDRAVRRRVLKRLGEEIAPAVNLDGSIAGIIEGIVGNYVRWAAAHPSLHRLIERDLGGLDSDGSTDLGQQIEAMLKLGASALGSPVTGDDEAAIGSLAHAMIGAVVGATRHWLAKPDRTPDVEFFAARVADTVRYIVLGHARRLGIGLRGDTDLSSLFSGGKAAPPAP